MKRRPRIKYTAQQRSLMWERYREGSSLNDIARLFERNHSSISGIIGKSGGIRPTDKHRKKKHLTLNEPLSHLSMAMATQFPLPALVRKFHRQHPG